MYWVYCIENKINGKKYIGKAKNPSRRWASHLSFSKKESKHQKYIHRAISKYGIDNFWFRCIDFSLFEKEALKQERYWIKFFNTTNPSIGYNLTLGGEGKSGYKHTLETIKLLSEMAKNRTGATNPFYNKTHSNQTIDKIRKARTKVTDQQFEYLIDSYQNKKLPVKRLAQEIGISVSHAYDLINGKYVRKQ